MLCGARRARWYGSRFVGLGPAFVLSVVVIGAPHLWQVVVALLLGTFILGTAAWACFCNSGFDQRQHAAGKPALAISLALGWVVIVAFAAVLLADVVERFWPAPSWSYHVTLRDGSVCRIDQNSNRRFKITDVAGKSCTPPALANP